MQNKLKEISNTMIKNGIVDMARVITIRNSYFLQKDFYDYSCNFKQAAWKVANEVVSDNNISKLDTMFFSVTFLYRHSIELLLKAIAFKFIKDDKQKISFLKDTFHNLSMILDYIEPFIQEPIKMDIECYKWLKQLLQSMNDVDKESDSFRYPFSMYKDKNNNKYRAKWFFEEQTHINLTKLVNKMEIAFEILEKYYLENQIKSDLYKTYNPIFLEEGGHYYEQSVIGFKYNRSEMYLYISAYHRAAKSLYNEGIINDKKMNSFFLPLCYLYKNALELSLKEIVLGLYPIEKALEIINNKKHSVFGIWGCIELDIVKRSGGSKNDAFFINNKNAIREIHNFDATADKFRYPIDKKLNYYFKEQKRYDIESFNNFFNGILSFLDGVSGLVSHQNDMLTESEMEIRDSFYY